MKPAPRARTTTILRRAISVVFVLALSCEDRDERLGFAPAVEPTPAPPASPDAHPGHTADGAVDLVPDAGHPHDAADAAGPEVGDAPAPEVSVDTAPEVSAETAPEGSAETAPEVSVEVSLPDVIEVAPPPCSGAGCPNLVAPGQLRLWLRGDLGVDCDTSSMPARVRSWADLSGRNNHARPTVGLPGPVCGADAGQIAGRAVVGFPLGLEQIAGEHLEIDLGAIAHGPFTLVMVEKRVGRFSAFLIGSRMPNADATNCGINVNASQALLFGYDRASSAMVSTWGPNCDLRVAVGQPGTRATVTIATFAPGTGFVLYRDGVRIGAAAGEMLHAVGTGYIGRGWQWAMDRVDSRYQGSVAELAIYSAVLADGDRQALEAYLKATWDTGP